MSDYRDSIVHKTKKLADEHFGNYKHHGRFFNAIWDFLNQQEFWKNPEHRHVVLDSLISEIRSIEIFFSNDPDTREAKKLEAVEGFLGDMSLITDGLGPDKRKEKLKLLLKKEGKVIHVNFSSDLSYLGM